MKSGFRPDSRLRQLGDSPQLLLLVTGALLGGMPPMSRLARASGWSPLAFAFWPALGVSLLVRPHNGYLTVPTMVAMAGIWLINPRPHEART